jgi:hypothetical protein
MKNIFLLFVLAASVSRASDWFVATNGSSAGNGSITNPWSLQVALTNDGTVNAGDTIWLRGGTYAPVITNGIDSIQEVDTNGNYVGTGEVEWVTGLNGPAFGSSNSFVTIRSCSNEWAMIDGVWRDSYQPTDANGKIQWGYLQFRDLEFYDSMKGHHATNYSCGGDYTNGPWSHFGPKFSKAQDFVNCVVHDVDNCFGYTVRSIRGCVIWNVGLDGYEHVCYPSPTSDFSGNVVGWTVNDIIEHSSPNFLMQSNIIFGSGQTSTNSGGIESNMDGVGVRFHNNYAYDYFPLAPNSQGFVLGGNGGSAIVTNNVIVEPSPITFLPNGYTNVVCDGNVVFMDMVIANARESSSAVLDSVSTNTLFQTINHNQYFVNSSPYAAFGFAQGKPGGGYLYFDWGGWRAQNPTFDTASTTNYGPPTNMVFVIPNQDEARRCNIAVYNFESNNTVGVNLSGVLNAGDPYKLYNAQDYNRGAIQTGVYNGTNIAVPMTNLTTAPIVYGTNWGLFQPPPMSPTFGAFVVIGSPGLVPPNDFRVIFVSP